MKRPVLVSFGIAALVASSHAAGLNLDYSVVFNGTNYDYNMTLSVDESVTPWASGMGWTWITFGDVAGPSTSPLSDFVLTSPPPGPWDSLAFSSGGHNGPTWLFNGSNIVYWIPTSASETISWTGTSSNPGNAGTLFFSELLVTGGASNDNFEEMRRVVPEPASFLALGVLLPLAMRRRRRRA